MLLQTSHGNLRSTASKGLANVTSMSRASHELQGGVSHESRRNGTRVESHILFLQRGCNEAHQAHQDRSVQAHQSPGGMGRAERTERRAAWGDINEGRNWPTSTLNWRP